MSNEENKKGVSRRSFIKGAAIGTVAIASAGSLIGCSPQEETPNAGETPAESSTPSFLKKPDPIPDSAIKETVTADVVGVGAGMSVVCHGGCRRRSQSGNRRKDCQCHFRK